MKILGYLGICLMVVLMGAAVFTCLAPKLGWRVDTVLSGSMEPKLGIGAVAVTRPVSAQQIQTGDIITFHSPLDQKLITHRVISVVPGTNIIFRTKGDANDDADPFVVTGASVVGKVVFQVPHAGYVAQFLKTRQGILLTLFVPGLIIIASELWNIWKELSAQLTERKYRAVR